MPVLRLGLARPKAQDDQNSEASPSSRSRNLTRPDSVEGLGKPRQMKREPQPAALPSFKIPDTTLESFDSHQDGGWLTW